jgi:hypothetical protein
VYAEAPVGYGSTTPERVADTGQKLFQFGYRYRAGAPTPTPRPVAYLSCTAHTVGQGGWSEYHMDVEVAPNGGVWVATNEGVRLFERPADPQAGSIRRDLPGDPRPRTLTIGPDGTVWLGTNGGAASFDGQTWTLYTTEDGLAENTVGDIAVDAGGTVWFSTDYGISTYNPGTHRWLTNAIDLETVRHWPIGMPVEATPNGSVWLFPYDQVYQLEPAKLQGDQPAGADDLRPIEALSALDNVRSATAAGDLLWVFGWSEKGPMLARFDPATDQAAVYDHATTGGAMYGAAITNLAAAEDGSVWLTLADTEVSALHFLPRGSDPASGTWIEYGPDSGLGLGNLLSVAVEAGGAVWFGTDDGTVARCTEQSIPPLGTPPLPSPTGEPTQTPVVCATPPANAYAGWTTYTTADGLASNQVKAVAIGPDGAVWFGTGCGVSRYLPPR